MRSSAFWPLLLLTTAAPLAAQGVTFTKIVDETTPIRGWGHSPALDAGQVAFLGENATTLEDGIYRAAADGSGAPLRIVAASDPLPNVPGQSFVFLDNPDIYAGAVTFTAGYSFSSANNTGIYEGSGGALTVVYDHADPLGGSPGRIPWADALEASLGSPFAPDGSGIYGYRAGQTFRILDTTQMLAGETLIGMTFDFRGLDGNSLAMRVTFHDPSHPTFHVRFGVFVADIDSALGTSYCLSTPSSSGCAVEQCRDAQHGPYGQLCITRPHPTVPGPAKPPSGRDDGQWVLRVQLQLAF